MCVALRVKEQGALEGGFMLLLSARIAPTLSPTANRLLPVFPVQEGLEEDCPMWVSWRRAVGRMWNQWRHCSWTLAVASHLPYVP